MRKQSFLFIAFIAVSVLAGAASGGQIHLNNGDRLTGTVSQMVDGVVTVKTDLAGEVKVPLANIRSIQTDAAVRVQQADGNVTEQAITGNTDLSTIAAINPPEPEKPRWKGEISGALIYSRGNTTSDSYSASVKLSKRTEKDRTTLKADAARQRERTAAGTDMVTEDWFKGSGKYDYFLSKKWYLFGQGRYETDKVANLDQRTVLGGGLGYQWIDTERTQFSIDAGLARVEETYEGTQGDNTSLSASAGYEFAHTFNDTFSFMSGLTYYPSTEDLADYYLTSSHELRAKINDHLFTNFRVLFDYDDTPATGQDSTDVKYIFGIGLTF